MKEYQIYKTFQEMLTQIKPGWVILAGPNVFDPQVCFETEL